MKFELSCLETVIDEKQTNTNEQSLNEKLAKETNRITTAWQKIAIQQAAPMAKKYFQQHQLALLRIQFPQFEIKYIP